jgi:hypothetical protein
MSALKGLLESGPLTDDDDIHYPFVGRSATFSAKLKMLQKSDAHALVAKDHFPFIWEVDGLPELKKFPVARLSDTSVLVVETHISSYAIPARGQSSGRNGYSALRAIYVASESDPGFAVNKFEMEFYSFKRLLPISFCKVVCKLNFLITLSSKYFNNYAFRH